MLYTGMTEKRAFNYYSQPMNIMDDAITGLSSVEVQEARQKYGSNKLIYKSKNVVRVYLAGLLRDPMILLLLLAVGIYAANGDAGDSLFLAVAVLLVAAISWFQERRSAKALQALKELSRPRCKVMRNGELTEIDSDELVTGDILFVEEGVSIAADGIILSSNDFCVNESALTGESLPVFKDKDQADHFVYRGTTVVGGLAIIRVTGTGNSTRLGAIGKSIEGVREQKSPLEDSINDFIMKMAVAGAAVFLVVWILNYYSNANFTDSLLKSLTLAMSILPEEIPVAFATFMALAAWRMIRQGIVVKEMKTVETLGSATVICVDKTGTITENKMTLAGIYALKTARICTLTDVLTVDEQELIRMAMWASEPIPFDPMEVALHETYERITSYDERPDYKMLHEYPLSGKPPMMTHIFAGCMGTRIIAAKGAPEAMIAHSKLSPEEQSEITAAMNVFAKKGYRLLGVGEASFSGDAFPREQQQFSFDFKGIVAFYDPPKEDIGHVLQQFYSAGLSVKIITGDNTITTQAIANAIGFKGTEHVKTGDELMHLDDLQLDRCVTQTQIFTRMFPDAKLRVINALKRNGEIVAMTGDGINDGPALKAAHIGIAMGKKGTEIARQAASLVLLDDDLSGMVDAIAMGRKMYGNLKKAIRYIISIHIPIILIVFIPLAFRWAYPNILSPIHVIFLELIMGPTCSIIYENEPMEPNAMYQPPRALRSGLFTSGEIFVSIVQGMLIAVGVLVLYQWGVYKGYDQASVRTLVFISLIAANIILTLVNRSFFFPLTVTLQYRNYLVPFIILITAGLTAAILFIPTLTLFFGLHRPKLTDAFMAILISVIAVLWFEIFKWFRRRALTNIKY